MKARKSNSVLVSYLIKNSTFAFIAMLIGGSIQAQPPVNTGPIDSSARDLGDLTSKCAHQAERAAKEVPALNFKFNAFVSEYFSRIDHALKTSADIKTKLAAYHAYNSEHPRNFDAIQKLYYERENNSYHPSYQVPEAKLAIERPRLDLYFSLFTAMNDLQVQIMRDLVNEGRLGDFTWSIVTNELPDFTIRVDQYDLKISPNVSTYNGFVGYGFDFIEGSRHSNSIRLSWDNYVSFPSISSPGLERETPSPFVIKKDDTYLRVSCVNIGGHGHTDTNIGKTLGICVQNCVRDGTKVVWPD